MLDLQRMFEQRQSPMMGQRQTQDMPLGSTSQFNRGNRWGNNGITRLGDLFGGIFDHLGGLFGNHNGQPGTPTPTTPQTPLPQPMGNQYANPFGASVTGGTLGAMLARQPNYN